MPAKINIHNPTGLYYVSLTTVHWLAIFVREHYFQALVDSLKYNIQEKDLNVYAWCIMPSHLHMIIRSTIYSPRKLLQEFKQHTTKILLWEIRNHPKESRKEMLLYILGKSGKLIGHEYQFWQQQDSCMPLNSRSAIAQKVEFIHQRPLVAGFVAEASHWKFSSAIDFDNGHGLLPLAKL